MHGVLLITIAHFIVFVMSKREFSEVKGSWALCKLQVKIILNDVCSIIMLFQRRTVTHECANMTSSWSHLFVISAFHQQGKTGTEITVLCWLAWLSVTSVSSVDRMSASPLWNRRGDGSSAVICGRRDHTLPAAPQMETNPACTVSRYAFTAFFRTVQRPVSFLFIFSYVCLFVYKSACASQRSRYSIRTEQWQSVSKDYRPPQHINTEGTHALSQTYIEHTKKNKCVSDPVNSYLG